MPFWHWGDDLKNRKLIIRACIIDFLYMIKEQKVFIDTHTMPITLKKVKVNSKQVQLISGGRYDSLISDLGSSKKVNAVGAAINLWAR